MPRLSVMAAPYRQGYGNSCAIRKGGGEIGRGARPSPRRIPRANPLGESPGRIPWGVSTAQSEPPDQGCVPLIVGSLEVIEQPAALADHDQQPAARVKIFFMRRQMVGQIADPLGQDRYLNLGRSGVALLDGIVADERLLALGSNRHRVSFLQRLMMRTGRRWPASIRATATSSRSLRAPTITPSSIRDSRSLSRSSCGVTRWP